MLTAITGINWGDEGMQHFYMDIRLQKDLAKHLSSIMDVHHWRPKVQKAPFVILILW